MMKDKFKHIWNWFKITWLYKVTPYWVAHGLVALVISLIFGWAYAGFMFYAGREVRDVEKLHNWDMKKFDYYGFFAPLVVCVIIHLIKTLV